MKFEWEIIDNTGPRIIRRASVIGGWIVRSYTCTNSTYPSESMVFIPDQNHEWVIDE